METLIGIFELAIGRARGFARFTVSPRAFRVSIAVLIVVPVLLSVAMAGQHGLGVGLPLLLAVFCALLIPAVVSEALARRWGREAWWLRFAIGFNWSRIALTAVYAVLLVVAAVLVSAGYPNRAVAGVIQAVMVGYTLWFDWFLLGRGLEVSGRRAAVGVVAINFATFALVFGPLFLADALAPDGARVPN